ANFSMFLDLLQVRNAGGLPFNVRAMGVPPDGGWNYRRTCAPGLAGGLCMRSPFPSGLGAANTYVDANAAAYFPAVIQALRSQLPANLLPILTALNPTSAQVGSVMRYLVGNRDPVAPSSLTPIEPLKASFVSNYEIGYKGLVGGSTRLSASGWYQQRINFITAAQISTPNVFFEPTALGTYLGTQITAALVAQGMPLAQAQATATAAAQELTPKLAAVPVGTVTFDNDKLANRPDVMFTYRNVDKTISLWGVDIGFDQTLTRRFSLEGTYSFVNKDTFDEISDPGSGPLRLNAPKNKGSLALHFDDASRNFKAEMRARYSEGFAVNSGVYVSGVNFSRPGTTCSTSATANCYQYEPVPTATLLDASFTLDLPRIAKGASWSVSATNLLDRRVPTFVGVPSLGLMIMTRLQYNF
ncbi:MAG TPA: TonB-dependent receptor, partial [Gemmatimonadaceae bacterium]